MLFEENDLKPSTNFKSYQDKLNKESTQYLKTFKDHNSDTVEANLILRQNLSLFKQKYKVKPPLKRIDLIISELTRVFPKADTSSLKIYLEKNGFVSQRMIVLSLSVIHTVALILILSLLDLTLAFQLFSGFLVYILSLPTTCLLALEFGNNEKT